MHTKKSLFINALLVLMLGCAGRPPEIPVDRESVEPGTRVAFKGEPEELLGWPIAVGEPLSSVKLVEGLSLQEIDLSVQRSSVLFLSIVPSLDTPVCDAQTHYLGEKGDDLPRGVRRIVISRDTPFAQQRFAREANLQMLEYLSDYKEGAFGRSAGLLMEDLRLLARSVVIVNRKGVVDYIQVVPEISHLPDMEKAFQRAAELANSP